MKPPEYSDIEMAAERLAGRAIRTPLLHSGSLNELLGLHIFFKPENLQRTGSFKFRGAYNAITALNDEERARGVVTSSSGNHAQGVAEAARMFGIKASIVMPSDAPQIKIKRTRAAGATILEYDRATQDRGKMLADAISGTGGTLVHPYNDANVIAGQGTVGLEIVEDLKSKGIQPDRVVVCTGGGGLTCGTAMAIKHHFSGAKVHSAEPEGFDDYRRSLEAGEIVRNSKTAGSVCDAIMTPAPGKLGFSINQQLLCSGLVVSDKEALSAVKLAFEELKLVVEPGGAVALAATLKHSREWQGETVVVTLSGGNIDPKMLQAALETA